MSEQEKTSGGRTRWGRRILFGIVAFVILLGIGGYIALQFAPVHLVVAQDSGTIDQVEMPDGFEISIFADNVEGARTLRLGDNGTLFVSSRGAGNIYAIPNATSSETAEDIIIVDSDLNSPNGIDLVDGDLYVAEIGQITRYDDIEDNLTSAESTLITDALPEVGHHGWRYMGYAPDGMLYVAIGAPCNVCELEEMFGTIHRLNLDGTNLEEYVTGVRNSVGFDWHPETGELWFTNNGRDLMGDDIPPDTLHYAPEQGLHMGFPYCHAGTIADPAFGDERSCDEFTPPAQSLTPHGAALGMRFYTGDSFPESYQNQIFIAEHGSWNRSVPIGYRVMLATVNDNNEVISYEPFAEGWLNEETGIAWGRPVDVLVMPDGSLLVSDDAGDKIYRITYTG
ncbi:MAG: PQQ-dependent sugar dehydrogenase [Chloroflexota bacterium]